MMERLRTMLLDAEILWCGVVCFFRGHRPERFRDIFKDPDSVNAREAAALYCQLSGTGTACMRCGKAMP